MNSYDSDSSLENETDYTETNVNLGYASKEPTGDTISHLGGFPIWLDTMRTPSASFSRCKICNSPMSLLLQLNGDLPEYFPNDERRLHIFTCREKQCTRKPGSIRALREVRRHKKEQNPSKQTQEPQQKPEIQQQHTDLGTALFGATSPKPTTTNANPFSTSSQPSSTLSNPFASLPPTSTLGAKPPERPEEPPTETFASKLRISSPSSPSKPDPPSEPWPSEFAFPKPFPYLHLDADYETLIHEPPNPLGATSSSSSKIQYLEEDTNGLDKDTFESSLDKTFLRFSDRLAQNPEQVLRYEWKGPPLLYSSTDAVGRRFVSSNAKALSGTGMPRCDSCGAQRVFELQLVPGLIAALEEGGAEQQQGVVVDLQEGMEWGTVIVAVCGGNCAGEAGEVVFREEWCGVQWEERG